MKVYNVDSTELNRLSRYGVCVSITSPLHGRSVLAWACLRSPSHRPTPKHRCANYSGSKGVSVRCTSLQIASMHVFGAEKGSTFTLGRGLEWACTVLYSGTSSAWLAHAEHMLRLHYAALHVNVQDQVKLRCCLT